jgi:hypothetical protein
VSLTLSVTSSTATAVLVDLEVYSPTGAKVHQKSWNNESFSAGQTRNYTVTWSVPWSAARGTYTVKSGIFRNGWGALLSWNNSAGSFSVT